LKKIVLDAGPLIGLFYAKDTYHLDCVRGFEQLAQQKTILLTPIPILFEVYKWLLQRTQPAVAHEALEVMQESLHLLPLEPHGVTINSNPLLHEFHSSQTLLVKRKFIAI